MYNGGAMVTVASRLLRASAEVLLLLRQVGILAAEQQASGLVDLFAVPSKPGYVDAQSWLNAIRSAAATLGVARA